MTNNMLLVEKKMRGKKNKKKDFMDVIFASAQ